MERYPDEFVAGLESVRFFNGTQADIAKFVAEHVHAFQKDKLGRNYLGHLTRVVRNLTSSPDFDGYEPDDQLAMIGAAWLHGSLMHSGSNGFPIVTPHDLSNFGLNHLTIRLVELVTRSLTGSRHEQVRFLDELSGNLPARCVKLADLAEGFYVQSPRDSLSASVASFTLTKFDCLEDLSMTPEQEIWFASRSALVLEMKDQNCPICERAVEFYARYPRYVCTYCAAKVSDENGRKVSLTNAGFWGGLKLDDRVVEQPLDVWIDGRRCQASDVRFGGVIIQLV